MTQGRNGLKAQLPTGSEAWWAQEQTAPSLPGAGIVSRRPA